MAKNKNRKKRNRLITILTVIAIALGCVCGLGIYHRITKDTNHVPAASTAIAETEAPEEHYSASLFMVGDALLHDPLYLSVQQPDGSYDFHSEVQRIGEIAQNYDLAFYNQETILGGPELGFSGYPMFNSPYEFGDAMVDYGFNLVSLANNHSLDRGEAGIINSCNYWAGKEGVVTAGTYTSAEAQAAIPVYEINGITYTFLAWTYGCNGLVVPDGKDYLVNTFENGTEAMLEQVRNADALADVTIVSMHWGTEYYDEADDTQKLLAQQLSDCGADIIIGNHAHVIEPIEWVNDHKTIVFYALGNLISAQDSLDTWIGMMAALNINKTVKGDESSIEITDVRADLHYDYFNHYTLSDFQAIPFSQLTDEQLPDHDTIYQQYVGKITEYDSSIQVGGL